MRSCAAASSPLNGNSLETDLKLTPAHLVQDLQHEWELGVRIMAVLRDENGYLPGYTSTYDSCVSVNEAGKMIFRGMVLEQINGYPVRKRLQDPSFSNIKYVREMLYQLLSALDRGQRLLGFTHADMGLGNVMEHYPEVYPEGTYERAEDIPGFVESGSGHVMPLGPKLEFKIIDYGLVELNDKLAYTAGGTTPIQTIEKIEKEISGPVVVDSDEDMMFGPDDTRDSAVVQWKMMKPSETSADGDYYVVKPRNERQTKKLSGARVHKHTTQDRININGATGPVERMYALKPPPAPIVRCLPSSHLPILPSSHHSLARPLGRFSGIVCSGRGREMCSICCWRLVRSSRSASGPRRTRRRSGCLPTSCTTSPVSK